MVNDIIFVSTTLVDLSLVCLALRFGIAGLTGLLVTNVILVSSLGAKLISLFGHITNAGNVFYACSFFATMMIAEHFGAKKAFKSVLIGFLSLFLFVLMAEFTVKTGLGTTPTSVDRAITVLFNAVPRIALGSMVAYLLAQSINIYVFRAVRQKTGVKLIALRTITSSIAGQFVDSIIFFTIAFAGTLSAHDLVVAMLTGFAVKVSIGVLSVPFMKLGYLLKPTTQISYHRRVT